MMMPSQAPQQDTPLYHPTPMEEAFGLYVLETIFPSSYTQYLQSQQIHIPGQDAVAFLTTSGIHRLILRNVWTVADPNNEGTLWSMEQLHVILRLVGLAQNGHVEHELLAIGAAVSATGIALTPTQVLRDILRKTQPMIVPLAIFANVPPPSTEQLQRIYQNYQQQRNSGTNTSDFIMPAPQPTQPQMIPQPPPPPSQVPATTPVVPELPSPLGGMSVSDAFGDLAPAADAPLPSLPSQDSVKNTTMPRTEGGGDNTTTNDDDDDDDDDVFGGFSTSTTAAPAPVAITNNDTDDEFGGFTTSTTAPAPLSDEFGGFTATTLPVSNEQDDFGGFTASTTTAASTTDNAFGGFSSTAPPAAAGMDALDVLASADAPLPALGVAAATTTNANNNNATNDFGGFAMTDTMPSQPQSDRGLLSTTASDVTPAISASQSFPLPTATTSVGGVGMDAFDALAGGTVADAPLPSLTTAANSADDDFGGFADAPAAAEDDFGGFAGAPAPSKDFGGFADAPAPTVSTNNAEDDDDFGNFSDAKPSMPPPQSDRGLFSAAGSSEFMSPPAIAASQSFPPPTTTSNDLGGMDAFDALSGAQDAPLPRLSQFGATAPETSVGTFYSTREDDGKNDNAKSDDENDDDMGDFVDANENPASMTDLSYVSAGSGHARHHSMPNDVNESAPKDLMPHLPGEKFVQHHRHSLSTPGGLLNIRETSTGEEGQTELGDPFAGLDPAPGSSSPVKSRPSLTMTGVTSVNSGSARDLNTLELNLPLSATSSVEDTMPQDLIPHAQGEHYVPHSHDPDATPGGLATVADNDAEDFGNFEGGGATDKTNEDSFGDFAGAADVMPHDLVPPAPGTHYVPHHLDAVGGLGTVGEDQEAGASGLAALGHLNPPTTLGRQSTPMPQDLKPHAAGEHYVPHSHEATSTPGGLATLGEAFEDLGPSEDAPLPSLGSFGTKREKGGTRLSLIDDSEHAEEIAEVATEDELEDFGDFAASTGPATGDDFAGFDDASVGLSNTSQPTQLSRQATPAPQDLQQTTRSMNVPSTATIQEDDDGFGGFEEAFATAAPAVPTPSGLTRQVTPAPQDLQASDIKAASAGAVGGAAIVEGDKEGEEDDDFGGFEEAAFSATPGQADIAAPPQMKRQETPRPQDLHPDLPGQGSTALQPGLESVGESFGETFDSFASAGLADMAAPPQLSRQATPAPQELEQSKRVMTTIESATIHEDEEGDEFGGFAAADSETPAMPPPTGLSRQVTPAPQDLQAFEVKPASATTAMGGMAIEEEDEDGGEKGDALGDFEQVGMPGQMDVLAPPQMLRQETPQPQDLKPRLPGQSITAPSPGLTSIGESFVEVGLSSTPVQEGSDSTAEEDDPFAAFDTLADPQPTVTPLSAFNPAGDAGPEMPMPAPTGLKAASAAGVLGGAVIAEEGDEDEDDFGGFEEAGAEMSSMAMPAPTGLTRQVTPAPQDLQASELKPASVAGTLGGAAIMEEAEDEDDFGGFEDAGLSNMPLPTPSGLTRQVTPAPQDLQASELKPASAASAMGGLAIQEGEEDEDDFGGFADAAFTTTPEQPETSEAPDNEARPDSFGDFGGFNAADSGTPAVPPPGGLTRQVTPAPQDLQASELKPASAETAMGGMAIAEGEEDDDFGDFGDFEQTGGGLEPPAPAVDTDNDDFGSFAAFSAAPPQDTAGPADDFGDFSAFSSSPAPAPTPAEEPSSDGFGGFDAFQESAVQPSAGGDDTAIMRHQIVSFSRSLPEPYRANIDYGNRFDTNIGKSASLGASKKRAERCVQLLSLLSGSHAKLASTLWVQVLAVARDELSRGRHILQQASSLSPQEKQETQKPLEVMVAGLGEFIRAVRSIVAAVGDILLLEPSTPFNTTTVATSWGGIPLTQSALELEVIWDEVLSLSSRMGLGHLTKLESVEEIRRNCLSRCPCNVLCQLTLQPLSDTDRLTKTKVAWGGKTFMACSANFLANKCPFYVIDE